MSDDKPQNIHITSHNQSGGITAHTVNVGSQPRHLNPQVAVQLDQHLITYRSQKIRVTSVMGDQEAFQFASEIKSYLVSKGFSVEGVDQAVYAQPITGQILQPNNEVLEIIIGGRQ